MNDNQTDDGKVLAFLRSKRGAMDALLQLARETERTAGESKNPTGDAWLRCSWAMHVAARLVGEPTIELALQHHSFEHGDRAGELARLYAAMGATSGFFRMGSSPFDAARGEIANLLAGDQPRFFRRLDLEKRGPVHRHAIARLQGRALQWRAFFRAYTDKSASQVDRLIQDAFGENAGADVVRQWKRQVVEEFGQDHLNWLLKHAKGKWAGTMMAKTETEALERMKADGEEYQAVIRWHLRSVDSIR